MAVIDDMFPRLIDRLPYTTELIAHTPEHSVSVEPAGENIGAVHINRVVNYLLLCAMGSDPRKTIHYFTTNDSVAQQVRSDDMQSLIGYLVGDVGTGVAGSSTRVSVEKACELIGLTLDEDVNISPNLQTIDNIIRMMENMRAHFRIERVPQTISEVRGSGSFMKPGMSPYMILTRSNNNIVFWGVASDLELSDADMLGAYWKTLIHYILLLDVVTLDEYRKINKSSSNAFFNNMLATVDSLRIFDARSGRYVSVDVSLIDDRDIEFAIEYKNKFIKSLRL